jgi:hypothetical protein
MSNKITFPSGSRTHSRIPNPTDVVFRLGASCFAIWVVTSVATSPVGHLRPSWWPVFLVGGGLFALAMLFGALMTLNMYLRNR